MSISDLMVLRGRVGTELTLSRPENGEGRTFCRFRMVVPRSRRRDNGEWEDLEPLWYTVKSWGALAENMAFSLRKGQPIVVAGRPAAHAWVDGAGELRSELSINAFTVGHDLGLGGSFYKRMAPGSTLTEGKNTNTTVIRPSSVSQSEDADISVEEVDVEERQTGDAEHAGEMGTASDVSPADAQVAA